MIIRLLLYNEKKNFIYRPEAAFFRTGFLSFYGIIVVTEEKK